MIRFHYDKKRFIVAGKNDLVSKLAEETELTQGDVRKVIDALPDVIRNIVIEDENNSLTLPGFIKVDLQWQEARQGRNPSNGETIDIAARYNLKVASAKSYKDSVAVAEDTEDSE